MVQRVSTVAFRDVKAQNASGAARLANRVMICLIAAGLLFCASRSAFAGEDKCPLNDAEYIPQHQVIADSYDKNVNLINKTLSFILRVERGNRGVASRGVFLNFDAYNKAGQRVSTMRFGDAWSNGMSRQSFSTYWGQYHEPGDMGWKELKHPASFYPVGVNKDYSQASLEDAPYLLIFPGTLWELTYNSFNNPRDWDDYIRFYTKDKIYPDFREYDFWVRKKCGRDEDKS